MAENAHDPGMSRLAAEPWLYFFLSHAHVKPHHLIDDDPGRLVMTFFRDLCQHLMQMTNCPGGELPGYVDLSMRSGTEWDPEIKRALGVCRAFVPLYGPRYFASEYCAMEWGAFSHREQLHRKASTVSSTQRAIVPVLWSHFDPGGAPQVARNIQLTSFDMDARYRRIGIYGLLSTKRWDDYDTATYEIARDIVETAELTQIEPCDPSMFDSIENPFQGTIEVGP
ncbi:TIR-like protein FxsC [Nonomuraea soli]|uniref:TIR domain-containing protein n=1 Tax=Nonomuraea soli TaxID=1032476 RepID=A0A7W0HN84_9ACTN|nr:TIR-like protein FxsC [Nonomuraea soli]MBA2889256.1 hypothetical protein [Nonomuraea soli]